MKSILDNKKVRMLILAIGDIIIGFLSGAFALALRFEFIFDGHFDIYFNRFYKFSIYYILIILVVFILFKMYTTMWSVASIREAFFIFLASIVICIFQILIAMILKFDFPRSYYILSTFIFYALEMIWRFSYRISRIIKRIQIKNTKRVMIVGAGAAGATLLKEIKNSDYINAKVVCFIDDNEYKIGKNLNGVKIYGGREMIPSIANKLNIDEIYVALPSASGIEKKAIYDIASKTKCKLKMLPGIYQLANGDISVSKLREVDIEDLLGRKPVKINTDEILSYVENEIVLVTGAGGSIGSEICRQIARHIPKKLILLDIYENSVYDLQNELKREYKNLNFETLIASVRNEHRIDKIFEEYKPTIVFHAAAHKHVPLMEVSPNEAVKNNCFGTLNVVNASDKYNVKKFILISTDKAVNPTNIMGATKRICEMIVQHKSRKSKTSFVAVRFGNVLGSNGSVVPLFKKQIEQGGPLTVTSEDIIRYFMTIPEAVALVLQAGAYAKGGEIFVLDMGDPVKIIDMARNLIKLSGYEPDVDIKIEIVGLRPGEKMFEELLMNEEGMKSTNHQRIFIGHPIDFDEENFEKNLEDLKIKAYNDVKDIKDEVAKLVPTYTVYRENLC